ncbi:MAG: hypothetical protein JEZ14_17440, partial [Marinilabiliaceae bacterium]|nr:hypothetical protein [Marinilabiliaceae bacterium]
NNKRDGDEYDPNYGHYNHDERINKRTHLNASVMTGKGRIERIEDARQVLYILDALDKEGRLKRVPTDEEILQIARRVSELKNERFFDSRHKRINEIREMDAILKELDLISEEDALYYTNLYDMWQYGANEARLAGIRFSAGLRTKLNSNKSEVNDELRYEQKEIGYFGVIRLEYENPFHLKWQSSLFSEVSYGTALQEMEEPGYYGGYSYGSGGGYAGYNAYPPDDTEELDFNNLNATLGYTIGFYPIPELPQKQKQD